jgi:hypothetical protein
MYVAEIRKKFLKNIKLIMFIMILNGNIYMNNI